MDGGDTRAMLVEIARLLEDGGPDWAAEAFGNALSSGLKLEAFLVSNELWGGAGSIADEALISGRVKRRALEDLLVKLGRLQLASGKVNPRTEMWVRAFERQQAKRL